MTQTRERPHERRYTDAEVKSYGFQVLVQALGDVGAERFIFLSNRDSGDYTEWRQHHLYEGMSLHEVATLAAKADEEYLSRPHNPNQIVI